MGITPYGDVMSAIGVQCFYCHRVIEKDNSIAWMGATQTIFLHRRCTYDLVLRLMNDLYKLQSENEINDIEPHY